MTMSEQTKYAVILTDGAADYPLEALGGRTVLQAARKPNIDAMARTSRLGLVRTVPEGMPAGSDTANLSIFGYDPVKDYTGRSSLEAVSIGIPLVEGDVTFRCNLVTLSDEPEYAERTMVDYSSGEISTAESRELAASLAEALDGGPLRLYAGISYRHVLVWHGGPSGPVLTPPHDISGRVVGGHLPKGEGEETLLDLMLRSAAVLKDHPVNRARIAAGKRPATSIWLWGEGRKPSLEPFPARFGLQGSVISAVDLVKGIAICAGLKSVDVPGATGTVHTNFAGKAEAALDELRSGRDFVYIHLEAPDECGHQGDVEGKVRSIELIDEKVAGPVRAGLEKLGVRHRIMVLPDHPTPISIKTHTPEPVPFMIYDSGRPAVGGPEAFDEAAAASTGVFVPVGHTLMARFLERPADNGRE